MKNNTLRKGLEARAKRAETALKFEEAKRGAAYLKADEAFKNNTEAHELELRVIQAMLAELDKLEPLQKVAEQNAEAALADDPELPPLLRKKS